MNEKEYTLVTYRNEGEYGHDFDTYSYINEHYLIKICTELRLKERMDYTLVVSTVDNGKLVSNTDFLNSSPQTEDLERISHIILANVDKIIEERENDRKQKEENEIRQQAIRKINSDLAELERLKKLYPTK